VREVEQSSKVPMPLLDATYGMIRGSQRDHADEVSGCGWDEAGRSR